MKTTIDKVMYYIPFLENGYEDANAYWNRASTLIPSGAKRWPKLKVIGSVMSLVVTDAEIARLSSLLDPKTDQVGVEYFDSTRVIGEGYRYIGFFPYTQRETIGVDNHSITLPVEFLHQHVSLAKAQNVNPADDTLHLYYVLDKDDLSVYFTTEYPYTDHPNLLVLLDIHCLDTTVFTEMGALHIMETPNTVSFKAVGAAPTLAVEATGADICVASIVRENQAAFELNQAAPSYSIICQLNLVSFQDLIS